MLQTHAHYVRQKTRAASGELLAACSRVQGSIKGHGLPEDMAEAKRAELERLRREVKKLEEELGESAQPVDDGAASGDDDILGVSRESTVELLPRGERAAPVPRDTLRNALMVLLVSSIGNILEWFDFAVFGYFADTISVLFFPSSEPVLALAETFAVFAGAFCARPVGGIFFGYVGDRWGRKKAVLLSVRMMALATFCMGALPTYQTIGPLAPVALLIVRLFQGVSTGGQLVGSFLFTVEAAPPEHKALFGAVCFATANLGSALGSAVAALLHAVLDKEQLESWGWRIPFLLGLLAAIFGHAVKDAVHDSAETMAAVAAQDADASVSPPNPLRVAFVTHRTTTLIVMGVACFWPTMFYIAFVWVASYEATLADPPLKEAFSINTAMIVLSTMLFPPFGMLADKIGARKFMLYGCALCTVTVIPAFALIGQNTVLGTQYAPALGLARADVQSLMVVCVTLACRHGNRPAVVGLDSCELRSWPPCMDGGSCADGVALHDRWRRLQPSAGAPRRHGSPVCNGGLRPWWVSCMDGRIFR